MSLNFVIYVIYKSWNYPRNPQIIFVHFLSCNQTRFMMTRHDLKIFRILRKKSEKNLHPRKYTWNSARLFKKWVRLRGLLVILSMFEYLGVGGVAGLPLGWLKGTQSFSAPKTLKFPLLFLPRIFYTPLLEFLL